MTLDRWRRLVVAIFTTAEVLIVFVALLNLWPQPPRAGRAVAWMVGFCVVAVCERALLADVARLRRRGDR